MGWETTWEKTLNADASGGSDMEWRNILAAGTLSTSGTKVRVTFEGHSSTAGQIDGASIGERDGSTDDMADTFGSAKFKRLLFSGGDTAVLGAGQEVVSDELTFDLDETKDYLIHIWFDDGNYACRHLQSGADGKCNGSYNGGVDNTETQTVSFSSASGQTTGINKVEVFVDEGEDVTVQPSAQTSTFSAVAITAIILSSVLSPSAIAGTFSAQSPTITGNALTSPSAQVATLSPQAPTITGDANIAPSVQTTTASVISPSIVGDANVSAGVQTATFSVQSVRHARASPLTGVYAFSQPTPSFVANYTASVGVQTLTFSLPTLTTPQQAIIQPLVGAYTFSQPTPTVTIESVTTFPTVQDITASQPTITITTDQVLSPSAQTGTLSQPEISLILDYVQDVGVQDAIFSLQPPSIYTDADVTIQVAVQTASFSLPEESIISENILSVAVQNVTTSLPAVTITGKALVTPAAQAGTFAAQAATPTGDAIVSPDAQDATFSQPEITLTTVNVVSVGVQTLTFSQQAITISGLRAHCYPDAQTATFYAMSTTVVISIPISTAPTMVHIKRIKEWPYPDFGEFKF